MADLDERAIRPGPGRDPTIRADDLRPWMVRTAALAIAILAAVGLYLGVRGGRPASGVSITLTPGVAMNAAAAASAAPAQPLPRDQAWSTLSGPEVLPATATAPKSAASSETDSDEDDSDEPAAADAMTDDSAPPPGPAPAPTSAAPPTVTPPPAPQPAQTPDTMPPT